MFPQDYPAEEEGDFIEGIDTYCDRWCERCAMTAKCRLYAGESLRDALGGEDEDGETQAEAAGETPGGPVAGDPFGSGDFGPFADPDFDEDDGEAWKFEEEDDEEMARYFEQAERRQREARNHPCATESADYLDRVNRWLKENRAWLAARGFDLDSPPVRLRPGQTPETDAERLHDAAEIILWFHTQIHVKLQRALGSQVEELDAPDYRDCEWPSDADGSAKVALVGIDRSLSAWTALRELYPEKDGEIFEILVPLDNLRRLAEQQFPKARAFKRPGFDE
ncbi:MAG: hypothetical protein H7A53_08370 [Akkermansiaceae bacterium]|nr:hypothetical protein [Akkermansiaceae bacterium]MCP5550890.1 hypothetical protein [Akkermansiaceae bacterium]